MKQLKPSGCASFIPTGFAALLQAYENKKKKFTVYTVWPVA